VKAKAEKKKLITNGLIDYEFFFKE